MSELFLAVLNMSLTASYVILYVIPVRLLLKKHQNHLLCFMECGCISSFNSFFL